jgi:phage terminase large subunit-like protein
VYAERSRAGTLTFKKREDSDFVVGQVWSRLGAELLPPLRAPRPHGIRRVEARGARRVEGVGPRRREAVEDKANGPAIIEELRNDIDGIVAVKNNDGVLAGAWAVQPFVEAGNIWMPDPVGVARGDDWLDEVCGFPKAPTTIASPRSRRL